MRASFFRMMVLTLPVLAACDGRYVTYTANFNVDETIQIREEGAYSVGKLVSHQTFADIIDDIPDNAEIERVTITALAADLTILPSTNATSVDIAFSATDDGVDLESLSFSKNVNIAAAQVFLGLAFVADDKVRSKIEGIRNRINQMLAVREPIDGLILGLNGTVNGGRLDADANVKMKVSVTYRVCENIGGELMASEMSECVAGPLD